MNSTGHPPSEWDRSDLEEAADCPVCGISTHTVLHEGLEDLCFHVAPGQWRLCACTNCGCARLSPRPTPSSIGLAYSQYYTHTAQARTEPRGVARIVRHISDAYLASRYGQVRPQSALAATVCRMAWPLRGFLDGMMRHLPGTPGRLLDVGCGNGTFLRMARDAGWDVAGVDFDPHAVETARASGLEVICGTLDTMPSDITNFDYIAASHVIEHVYDPANFLSAAFQRLRPGGQLWIETPNLDATGHRRFGRHWRGLEPPRHLTIFTDRTLRQLLQQAGFEKIRRLYRGPMAPLTYAESEALAQGRPLGSFGLAQRHRMALCLDMLKQECLPQQREFLTLRAQRPLPL